MDSNTIVPEESKTNNNNNMNDVDRQSNMSTTTSNAHTQSHSIIRSDVPPAHGMSETNPIHPLSNGSTGFSARTNFVQQRQQSLYEQNQFNTQPHIQQRSQHVIPPQQHLQYYSQSLPNLPTLPPTLPNNNHTYQPAMHNYYPGYNNNYYQTPYHPQSQPQIPLQPAIQSQQLNDMIQGIITNQVTQQLTPMFERFSDQMSQQISRSLSASNHTHNTSQTSQDVDFHHINPALSVSSTTIINPEIINDNAQNIIHEKPSDIRNDAVSNVLINDEIKSNPVEIRIDDEDSKQEELDNEEPVAVPEQSVISETTVPPEIIEKQIDNKVNTDNKLENENNETGDNINEYEADPKELLMKLLANPALLDSFQDDPESLAAIKSAVNGNNDISDDEDGYSTEEEWHLSAASIMSIRHRVILLGKQLEQTKSDNDPKAYNTVIQSLRSAINTNNILQQNFYEMNKYYFDPADYNDEYTNSIIHESKELDSDEYSQILSKSQRKKRNRRRMKKQMKRNRLESDDSDAFLFSIQGFRDEIGAHVKRKKEPIRQKKKNKNAKIKMQKQKLHKNKNKNKSKKSANSPKNKNPRKSSPRNSPPKPKTKKISILSPPRSKRSIHSNKLSPPSIKWKNTQNKNARKNSDFNQNNNKSKYNDGTIIKGQFTERDIDEKNKTPNDVRKLDNNIRSGKPPLYRDNVLNECVKSHTLSTIFDKTHRRQSGGSLDITSPLFQFKNGVIFDYNNVKFKIASKPIGYGIETSRNKLNDKPHLYYNMLQSDYANRSLNLKLNGKDHLKYDKFTSITGIHYGFTDWFRKQISSILSDQADQPKVNEYERWVGYKVININQFSDKGYHSFHKNDSVYFCDDHGILSKGIIQSSNLNLIKFDLKSQISKKQISQYNSAYSIKLQDRNNPIKYTIFKHNVPQQCVILQSDLESYMESKDQILMDANIIYDIEQYMDNPAETLVTKYIEFFHVINNGCTFIWRNSLFNNHYCRIVYFGNKYYIMDPMAIFIHRPNLTADSKMLNGIIDMEHWESNPQILINKFCTDWTHSEIDKMANILNNYMMDNRNNFYNNDTRINTYEYEWNRIFVEIHDAKNAKMMPAWTIDFKRSYPYEQLFEKYRNNEFVFDMWQHFITIPKPNAHFDRRKDKYIPRPKFNWNSLKYGNQWIKQLDEILINLGYTVWPSNQLECQIPHYWSDSDQVFLLHFRHSLYRPYTRDELRCNKIDDIYSKYISYEMELNGLNQQWVNRPNQNVIETDGRINANAQYIPKDTNKAKAFQPMPGMTNATKQIMESLSNNQTNQLQSCKAQNGQDIRFHGNDDNDDNDHNSTFKNMNGRTYTKSPTKNGSTNIPEDTSHTNNNNGQTNNTQANPSNNGSMDIDSVDTSGPKTPTPMVNPNTRKSDQPNIVTVPEYQTIGHPNVPSHSNIQYSYKCNDFPLNNGNNNANNLNQNRNDLNQNNNGSNQNRNDSNQNGNNFNGNHGQTNGYNGYSNNGNNGPPNGNDNGNNDQNYDDNDYDDEKGNENGNEHGDGNENVNLNVNQTSHLLSKVLQRGNTYDDDKFTGKETTEKTRMFHVQRKYKQWMESNQLSQAEGLRNIHQSLGGDAEILYNDHIYLEPETYTTIDSIWHCLSKEFPPRSFLDKARSSITKFNYDKNIEMSQNFVRWKRTMAIYNREWKFHNKYLPTDRNIKSRLTWRLQYYKLKERIVDYVCKQLNVSDTMGVQIDNAMRSYKSNIFTAAYRYQKEDIDQLISVVNRIDESFRVKDRFATKYSKYRKQYDDYDDGYTQSKKRYKKRKKDRRYNKRSNFKSKYYNKKSSNHRKHYRSYNHRKYAKKTMNAFNQKGPIHKNIYNHKQGNCYACGKPNHVAFKCFDKVAKDKYYKAINHCNKCWQSGHLAESCTKWDKKMTNKHGNQWKFKYDKKNGTKYTKGTNNRAKTMNTMNANDCSSVDLSWTDMDSNEDMYSSSGVDDSRTQSDSENEENDEQVIDSEHETDSDSGSSSKSAIHTLYCVGANTNPTILAINDKTINGAKAKELYKFYGKSVLKPENISGGPIILDSKFKWKPYNKKPKDELLHMDSIAEDRLTPDHDEHPKENYIQMHMKVHENEYRSDCKKIIKTNSLLDGGANISAMKLSVFMNFKKKYNIPSLFSNPFPLETAGTKDLAMDGECILFYCRTYLSNKYKLYRFYKVPHDNLPADIIIGTDMVTSLGYGTCGIAPNGQIHKFGHKPNKTIVYWQHKGFHTGRDPFDPKSSISERLIGPKDISVHPTDGTKINIIQSNKQDCNDPESINDGNDIGNDQNGVTDGAGDEEADDDDKDGERL